jgi:hypothetical protein
MGTVSRVHTFASGAILTAAQLNNEFDNLLTSSAINGGLDATNLGVTAGQATASKALVVDASRNLADATGSNRINNLALSGTFESTGAVTASAGITSGGNIVSDTDSTDDLGTTGVRWANLFVDDVTVTNNVTIGGTLTLTGGITLNGNTTIGDSSADTLTVNSTITSNLLFTDATYDIGASGATRPRDLFLSRNAVMGGTLGVTGATTLSSTLGVTGALTATAGITSGSDIVSDSDSTDDLGTTSVRWANLYVDSIGDTGQALAITAGSNNINVTAGTLALTGAQTISSTLGVTGLITASGGLSGTTGTFSGDLAVGTDKLFVDVSASAVGVGTSLPATLANYALITTSDTSGGGLVCQYNGTSKLAVYSANNDAYYDAAVQHIFRTGGVFSGSTAMTIDSSQRVGIGTSSPTRLLSLYSNSPTSVFQSFTNSSTGNTASDGAQIGIDSNNDLQIGQLESGKLIEFYNNGSLAMVIDSSQRVGIGTSSPATKLVIDSGSTASGVRIQSSSNADFLSFLNTSTGGRQWTLANAGASNVHSVNAGTFYIRDSTAGANRLAIDELGAVGIGTDNPDFNTDLHIVNNSVAQIRLTTGTAASTYLTFGDSADVDAGRIIYANATDSMLFYTSGSSAMAIDSSQRVGIGTVSPSALLHLYKSGSTQAGLIETDQSASVFNFKSTGQTAGQPQIGCSGSNLILNTNGTERARILSSGGITFNGDTASANALDDYEEGTWTPTIIATTTNPTVGYSVQYGRYTKIGNIVTVQLKIDLSSFSGGSGGINIGGFPFTSRNDSNYRSAGSVSFARNVTNGGGAIMLNLGPNVNRVSLIKYTNADNYDTNVAPSDLASNSIIHATMTYEAQ